MKKRHSFRRVAVAVGLAHLLLIGCLVFIRSSKKPPRRPPSIRVGLASLHSPAPTSRPEREPDRVRKTTPKSRRPNLQTSSASNRRASSKPDRKWRARTPEEIRRGLTTTPRRPQEKKTETKQLEMDQLRALVREFARDAHASNQHGEPISVSDDYMAKVHARLTALWRQPTRTEVGDGNLAVLVNLEIRRNGRVSGSSITRPSGNLTLNQSVKALLNKLDELPPLPDSIQDDVLRLDVTLRLE